ncbi:uncharacterized protein EV154DRAFT_545778 [Mucor mucedo]|uniref:uncharacterized protein n=1 Tax=Mucor mucedo TaxID=29922 RepID=UPI002220406B|nr:uncharacterized protein EV154DRAFT_545778 [Mucor mucedo]KAI7877892.1 hypothetical protein EV154DRAFT_545778 [Mucor mucedo]
MTVSPPRSPSNVRSPISRPNSSIGDNISKKLEQKLDTRCIHTITQEDKNSVLSLATSEKYVFSGSQGSKIHVWDLATFQLVTVFEGHCGSVLGLTLSDDQQWLFSCSGDGTVRVWDIGRLKCSHIIRSCHDVGDIFSIVYTEKSHLLFFGCQNTSIQWYDFDHQQQDGHSVAITQESSHTQKTQFFKLFHDLGLDAKQHHDYLFKEEDDLVQCVIKTNQVRSNAHDGYVYCMASSNNIPNVEGEVLITGSGDGNIKIWTIQNKTVTHYQTLTGGDPDRGILSLTISDDGYLFCGVQGGHVQIWDLETYQLIRSVVAHSDDVLSVMAHDSGFISASADGIIKFWNDCFDLTELVDDHSGIILSMAKSNDYLITGSSDHSIKIWDVPSSKVVSSPEQFRRNNNGKDDCSSCDLLLYVLEKWVAIRTVSGNPQYLEECRRGARFFKNILQQLGAKSQLIPGATGRNPLIYAKFSANSTQFRNKSKDQQVPTVLFYGHYDVIAAENEKNEWLQDPFKLSGLNGYLYGRGTSDNKGPILASVFAVHELLKEGLLNVNVIFLIEGEEESGSHGFLEALAKHQNLFENIDLIILSNSYWLGEDVPCITYGLRGVIHASVTVTSPLADLHSGVEGGAVSEPLIDLIHVLGKLVDDDKKVLIPEFYDDVLPVSEAEEKLYDPIISWLKSSKSQPMSKSRSQHSCITTPSMSSEANSRYEGSNSGGSDDESVSSSGNNDQTCEQIKNQLMSRWRYPTLTVHKIDVPIINPTIISHYATSAVSMRIVPNQGITEICDAFKMYVRKIFERLKSDNRISIKIQSSADYWLGNPDSKYFKAAELAIEEEWKVKPLYIREGGSIPAVRWLEKFCEAPAIHIPFGQSSDQAHLPNERIRLRNLHAGRRIIKTLLKNIQ